MTDEHAHAIEAGVPMYELHMIEADAVIKALEQENDALKAEVADLRCGDAGPFNHCAECGRAMVWSWNGGAWMCPRCVLWRLDSHERSLRITHRTLKEAQVKIDICPKCGGDGYGVNGGKRVMCFHCHGEGRVAPTNPPGPYAHLSGAELNDGLGAAALATAPPATAKEEKS